MGDKTREKGVILKNKGKDKIYGFFRSEKHKEVYFRISDLPRISERDFPENWLNQNAVFEFDIEKNEKGYRANNIDYIYDRLPNDTRNIYSQDQIDNFHLKINKAARFENDKFVFPDDIRTDLFSLPEENNRILSGLNNRITSIQESYKKRGYKIWNREFKTEGRLVIGLGSESVYDTSITLHHIYGVPYIPGSAVKGLVRNWVISNLFDSKEGGKKEGALSSSEFCKIFGSPEGSALGANRGRVIFFDAFPVGRVEIEEDIVNSHFAKYYASNRDNVPPADYLAPNLIYFLTVKKDTVFRFCLSVKQEDNLHVQLSKYKGEILDVTAELLTEALTTAGIGAKTSVGYGLFKGLDSD